MAAVVVVAAGRESASAATRLRRALWQQRIPVRTSSDGNGSFAETLRRAVAVVVFWSAGLAGADPASGAVLAALASEAEQLMLLGTTVGSVDTADAPLVRELMQRCDMASHADLLQRVLAVAASRDNNNHHNNELNNNGNGDSPRTLRLPEPVPQFVGRDPLVQTVASALNAASSSGPGVARIALVGPSGSGKLELALHCVENLLDLFDLAWFVDGSSDAAARESLMRLAAATTGGVAENEAQLGRHLAGLRKPWLLLVANAPSSRPDIALEILRLPAEVASSCVCVCTIKGTDELPAQWPMVVRVGSYDEAGALSFCRQSLAPQELTMADTTAFSGQFGGSPLSMGLAADYIRARSWTLSQYLEQLRAHLSLVQFRLNEYEHRPLSPALVAHVHLCLASLPEQARAVLRIASVLPSRNMPRQVLFEPAAVSPEHDGDAICPDLIRSSSQEHELDMHPRVQEAVRVLQPICVEDFTHVVSLAKQQQQWATFGALVQCLPELLPSFVQADAEAACDLMSAVSIVPRWELSLPLDAVAAILTCHTEALRLCERANIPTLTSKLMSATALLSEHHGEKAEVAAACGRLAEWLMKNEQEAEALVWLERGLGILAQQYGLDFTDALNEPAPVQGSFARLRAALRDRMRSSTSASQWQGDESQLEEAAVALLALATVISKPKRQEMQERALQLLHLKHGTTPRLVVANALEQLGQLDDALQMKRALVGDDSVLLCTTLVAQGMLDRAAAIYSSTYGAEHVSVARVLELQGQYTQALAIRERRPMLDRPGRAACLERLAEQASSSAEAKTKLQLALDIRVAVHGGVEHMDVARTQVALAKVLGALDDHDGKRALLDQALTTFEHCLDADDEQLADVLDELGRTLGQLGMYAEMSTRLERAVTIREKHLGMDHVAVADTVEGLAIAVGAANDGRREVALLKRALVIKEHAYGPSDGKVASTMASLAEAMGEQGDLPLERQMLETVLAIEERVHGADSIEAARIMCKLASNLCRSGEAVRAKTMMELALELKKAKLDESSLEIAMSLTQSAHVMLALGDYLNAKRTLERAQALFQARYDDDRLDAAATLAGLGEAVLELGGVATGVDLLQRALTLRERHYGHDHLLVAAVLVPLTDGQIASRNGADAANETAERAERIYQAAGYPNDHIDWARVYSARGRAIAAKDIRSPVAFQLLTKATDIWTAHRVPRTHPHVVKAYNVLMKLKPRKVTLLSKVVGKFSLSK